VSRRVVGRDLVAIFARESGRHRVFSARHIRLVNGIGEILREARSGETWEDRLLQIELSANLYDQSKRQRRSWIVQMTYFQALKQEGLPDGAPLLRCGESGRDDAEKLSRSHHCGVRSFREAVFGRRAMARIREMLTEDQWKRSATFL